MEKRKVCLAVTVDAYSGGAPDELLGASVEDNEEWRKGVLEYYKDKYIPSLKLQYKRDGLTLPKHLPELHFIESECPVGYLHRECRG